MRLLRDPRRSNRFWEKRGIRESISSLLDDVDAEFRTIYEKCFRSTMTSPERMYALWAATKYTSGVEGDVVECGVWKGGSSMLIAFTIDPAVDLRNLWLFDTFDGMPEPTPLDVDKDGMSALRNWKRIVAEDGVILAKASLDEVRSNMATTPFPADRIHYVEGLVEATIPAQGPDRISLLRLDTDWYESTRHELEHLWPRLSIGGVMIIDDYGHWAGCKKAVDEYFANQVDPPLLIRVDYTGRMVVKVSE